MTFDQIASLARAKPSRADSQSRRSALKRRRLAERSWYQEACPRHHQQENARLEAANR